MFLSNDFLKQYENEKFPGDYLGEFVYLRTYSRWLPEKNRREKWIETITRVVEYSYSLYTGHKSKIDLQKEAEETFDYLFNQTVFSAGRTMWIGNTKASEKFPLGNFNCSGVVIDSYQSFLDLFYALMVGCGVGFRVLKSDVDKLPVLNSKVVIAHKPYDGKTPENRIQNTKCYQDESSFYIIIGDNKESWVYALKCYFELMQNRETESIIFNYDNIRPEGEILKTFGGRASGYTALKEMFKNIHKIIQNRKLFDDLVKLKPVDCMDICNIIAQIVVVGGVRRSSQLCLFDKDDIDILNAKVGLYDKGSENYGKFWRSMSNNSILFNDKPTKNEMLDIFERVKTSFEPGIINWQGMQKRRPNANILNPCFTGDMRLLTKDGYVPFEDLNNKEVEVINNHGDVSLGKVWKSGNKQTIKLKLSNGQEIKCTPNHIFMTLDGKEIEAKDTKNVSLMTYFEIINEIPYVVEIEDNGFQDVYDFTEPINHWGIVEGFVVHNCCEIILDNKGVCNLTEIVLPKFIENNSVNYIKLEKAARIATQIGLRQTNANIELSLWDNVQKRDRLIGVSITGYSDFQDEMNYSNEKMNDLVIFIKDIVKDEAKKYSFELRIPEPLLTTTVKPSGTISTLAGVSSGMHRSFAPYYIRRIRINKSDPLSKVMLNSGIRIYPENGEKYNVEEFDKLNYFDKLKALENSKTWVLEFLVKSKTNKKASDESAIEQLNRYYNLQRNYTEHNTSSTIYVKNNEWEDVAEKVLTNWDDYIGISFLASDNNVYPLMPYEAITEEDYNIRISELKEVNLHQELFEIESLDMATELTDKDCVSGACPVR